MSVWFFWNQEQGFPCRDCWVTRSNYCTFPCGIVFWGVLWWSCRLPRCCWACSCRICCRLKCYLWPTHIIPLILCYHSECCLRIVSSLLCLLSSRFIVESHSPHLSKPMLLLPITEGSYYSSWRLSNEWPDQHRLFFVLVVNSLIVFYVLRILLYASIQCHLILSKLLVHLNHSD